MTKICSRCKKEKDLSFFSEYKVAKDGYRPWCKICHRDYQRYYRKENSKKYYSYGKKYRANHPEKANAHAAVWLAKRRGRLLQTSCEVCKSNKTEAHHPDYKKPLEVMWLCRTHHLEWHEKHKTVVPPAARLNPSA